MFVRDSCMDGCMDTLETCLQSLRWWRHKKGQYQKCIMHVPFFGSNLGTRRNTKPTLCVQESLEWTDSDRALRSAELRYAGFKNSLDREYTASCNKNQDNSVKGGTMSQVHVNPSLYSPGGSIRQTVWLANEI